MSQVRRGAIAVIAGLITLGFAVPAQAAPAPTPGANCSMSGATRFADGQTFICERDGSSLEWSRGLKRSTSPLQIEDAWIKAVDGGMTSAFATITNPTNKPIRVVAARSARYSPAVQLHEVAIEDGSMVMQEKATGFVIPAGGSVTLKPGADHLMLMAVKQPVTAGQRVPIRLITSDGGRVAFTAMGKVYAGANESYDDMGSGGMDMSQ